MTLLDPRVTFILSWSLPQFETMIQGNEAMNFDPRVRIRTPEYKNPCQFGFSGYDPMLCALVTGFDFIIYMDHMIWTHMI